MVVNKSCLQILIGFSKSLFFPAHHSFANVIDASLAFIVFSVRISIINYYLHTRDLVLIICKIVQGDDN